MAQQINKPSVKKKNGKLVSKNVKVDNKATPKKAAPAFDFLTAFDLLLKGPSDRIDFFSAGHVVPVDEAEECTDEFDNLCFKTSAPQVPLKLKQAYSWGVAFSGNDLLKWITEMVSKTKVVNNIRVVFGIYTANYSSKHPKEVPPEHINRLSVFLWPYWDNNKAKEVPSTGGAPVELQPYNLGGLQP